MIIDVVITRELSADSSIITIIKFILLLKCQLQLLDVTTSLWLRHYKLKTDFFLTAL